MIAEVIGKKGEKGSGGGRDAFRPGVTYVCAKAVRIELLNLNSRDWRDAGRDMELTAELSARVQKPYYHFILSWHEHERPSIDQQFAAMHHVIAALGLGDHQVVLGSHGDRNHCHIHAIANTVHPVSGKVWSKSNDHAKLERACREIEVEQGWAHDRGRFDFDVIEKDGKQIVKLKRNPDAWERKKQAREAGKRKPSPADIAFQKQHGFSSFAQDIPPALRDRFASVVELAEGWPALHKGLAKIGLKYVQAGSGARVQVLGSLEDAKASAFGQKFSMKKLEARYGPYEPPLPHTDRTADPILPKAPDHANAISPVFDEANIKQTRAQSFKMTLLRRIYTGLHLDDQVASQIQYVRLHATPPTVTFTNGAEVVDHGSKLTTNRTSPASVATMIAMAKAKGWAKIRPMGNPAFVEQVSIAAAMAGIGVTGVPEDVQALADEVLEQSRKKQRRIVHEATTALKDHLENSVDREVALNDNRTEEARRAAESILGTGIPGPAAPPGRPSVSKPQPAPDALKLDRGGALRMQHQLHDNDWSEIEEMKRIDIAIVAALGGWADVSDNHPDSTDRHGKRFKIFQKNGDTVKASLKDGKWLWTSNKTGQSGSVIDLYMNDSPSRNLGHARVAFRELLASAPFPVLARHSGKVPKPSDDHTAARQRWEEAPHIAANASNYATQRGISPTTLARFSDQVRAGAFGGIYFAHRNPAGDIQGFEQRWQKNGKPNAARFAKGGRKTVNILGKPDTATRMVVLEGGLDALAIAELEARDDTIYVSTGGGFGTLTEDALLQLTDGKDIISGFDNDAAGDALHAKLLTLLPAAKREAPPTRIEGSEIECKDWLDVLNAARDMLRQELAQKTASKTPASELVRTPSPSTPQQTQDEKTDDPAADGFPDQPDLW